MDVRARENYLTTQVTTAAPQKLKLMLLDGAIRFASQTLTHWQQDNDVEAMEALIRSRQIVAELLAGIESDKTPLARKVMAVYSYLFRTLTEAQLEHSDTKVGEAISILQVERETWAMVCEQLGTAQINSPPASTAAASPDAASFPELDETSPGPTGLSLQA